MKLVILESPYAADTPEGVAANVEYARQALDDCLNRGEAPFASHLLYTQVLDDTCPAERQQGIEAGFAWRAKAECTVVYVDRGISKGMLYGIAHAFSIAENDETTSVYLRSIAKTQEERDLILEAAYAKIKEMAELF